MCQTDFEGNEENGLKLMDVNYYHIKKISVVIIYGNNKLYEMLQWIFFS